MDEAYLPHSIDVTQPGVIAAYLRFANYRFADLSCVARTCDDTEISVLPTLYAVSAYAFSSQS